jgi:Lrp/AsnC family leucine-responsive transcriptional regulator
MDNTDREIIKELIKNARKSYNEIGEIIGYTTMGAKKRLDKLLKNQVIKTTALLNINELKLYLALVFLEVESAKKLRRIFKKFEKCPRIIHAFTTLSGYNLIALVFAEDKDTLESISVEKCSIRSQEGVRRSEFYPIGEIFYSPFLSIREDLCHQDLDKSPCGIYCVTCERFENNKCAGCAATNHYRGQL